MFSKEITDVKKKTVIMDGGCFTAELLCCCETCILAALNQRQCSFDVVSTLCVCRVKVSETTGQSCFVSSGERFNGANEAKSHK